MVVVVENSRQSTYRRFVPVIVIALVVLGGFLVWRQFFQTYHLAAVQEGVLYRDGNRGVREFANAVDKVKPKSVVCLIDDSEVADAKKPMFAEEFKLLEQRGIRLERIAVPLGGWPT